MSDVSKLKITLIKSIAKCLPKHKLCVKGLGLRGRLHKSVVVADTPEVRGMIDKVNYLLKVEAA